jgi:hypothetical protein
MLLCRVGISNKSVPVAWPWIPTDGIMMVIPEEHQHGMKVWFAGKILDLKWWIRSSNTGELSSLLMNIVYMCRFNPV